MLTTVLGCVVLLLTGLCGALALRVQHLKEQIDELCTQVGDRVADAYLLSEAKAELAEARMHLEMERFRNGKGQEAV